MRELLKRIVRRTLPVVIALGIMGYIYAEAYLILTGGHGPNADPANKAVRWRAPLVMAGAGAIITIVFEIAYHIVRRPPPAIAVRQKDPLSPPSPPEYPE